jgi:acetyl-CoA C-acetyltransferase
MARYLQECVIVEGVRTATGNFLGSLKDVKAYDMGAACVREIMKRTGLPGSTVDEVIFGNQFQAGNNANPARWAAWYGGLPETVPAFTPMKNCGTGLKAIILAAQSIQTGNNGVVLAGGMESMTRCPYYLLGARLGYRMGHGTTVRDGLFEDGLLDPIVEGHMGLTAENLARHYNIGRQEQDEFALESHHKAEAAWAAGKYQPDIVPIEIPIKGGKKAIYDHDETYRKGLTMDDLVTLKPAFLKGGTVTPGNASPLNDGAAAVLLSTSEKAKELGLTPIAKYVDSASAAYDPKEMGATPIFAVRKLLKQTGIKLSDIGLIELNEAFAVQALTCIKELGLDMGKVNVNGGAIALGHATGCTGARLTVTLIKEMRRIGCKYGIVTLCIGGGQGIAALYELCE